jgi:hypothetical protein
MDSQAERLSQDQGSVIVAAQLRASTNPTTMGHATSPCLPGAWAMVTVLTERVCQEGSIRPDRP